VQIEPQFAEHVHSLTDWHQFSLLSVESSFCPKWYKDGLLLIGDAAHVMSPVGGVGINYAIQDAVVAANLLAKPLADGQLHTSDLARVQRKREFATRAIQKVQAIAQKGIVASALQSQQSIRIPWYVRLFFKIPFLRDLPAKMVAFGINRAHLEK
jgi:2-polyprenyl-6-methoxyphenol hydroxylase-like FAD-dependent oxidoreductase